MINELVIEYSGNYSLKEFEILNSCGQIVYKGIIQEKTIVPTSNFSSGIYLVKISNGNSFEFMKIVKE